MNIFELFVILFLLVVISFPIYVSVSPVWITLHWITKVIYGTFILIGYVADWILGNTFFAIYFREMPSLKEGTISHRTKTYQYSSKLAKFIWNEIRKISPHHLG